MIFKIKNKKALFNLLSIFYFFFCTLTFTAAIIDEKVRKKICQNKLHMKYLNTSIFLYPIHFELQGQ